MQEEAGHMQLRIAVCDDEKEQLEYIKGLLQSWGEKRGMTLLITEYKSAEEFLFEYPEKAFDLLLLDIEMDGVSGMELAKRLRERGDMLPVLFITGFSEYVEQGYDVEALHYLLKPVSEERLETVLDRYVKKTGTHQESLLVSDGGYLTHVELSDILYIEADGRHTRVQLTDGSALLCEKGIGVLAKQGLLGFVQCHRAYLINLRHVRSIGKTEIVFDDKTAVALSRRLYDQVNQAFIRYYREKE